MTSYIIQPRRECQYCCGLENNGQGHAPPHVNVTFSTSRNRHAGLLTSTGILACTHTSMQKIPCNKFRFRRGRHTNFIRQLFTGAPINYYPTLVVLSQSAEMCDSISKRTYKIFLEGALLVLYRLDHPGLDYPDFDYQDVSMCLFPTPYHLDINGIQEDSCIQQT